MERKEKRGESDGGRSVGDARGMYGAGDLDGGGVGSVSGSVGMGVMIRRDEGGIGLVADQLGEIYEKRLIDIYMHCLSIPR